MRELKFRIWDGNNKHFVYPDILELGRGLEYQQFTGLLDKQGKEIYEGDKVRFKWNRKYWEGECAWAIDGFWVVGWLDALTKREYNELEVIGNIYDNPELMEVNNGQTIRKRT